MSVLLNVKISKIILKKDNRTILEDINFSLETSFIYTIVGCNASGKTTLLLTIANLINKNLFAISGEVYFNEEYLATLNTSEKIHNQLIRVVLQNPSSMFDPLKKLDYYFKLINDKNLLGMLFSEAQLPDISKASKKHIYEFSEGQAQRIAICLAIADQPKLLILDEPTSSLDPINIKIILKLIRNYVKADNCVLMVTHDYRFANSASDFIGNIKERKFYNFQSLNKDDL